MYKKRKGSVWLLWLILFSSFSVIAQPKWTFDPFGREEKPPQFSEKVLASERTADKKFTKLRRFIQNNVTHFNYYFNANTKISSVIENAKLSQQDDYTKLLSFYPYSLDNTASQTGELDSVIYKSTAGILIHDLRTDWVDNLYLLIGKSYFFRKEFDSAALTFQFINYNLFPRKKKEDEDRVVGENSRSYSSSLSIADKERRNLFKRMFTKPPSRNDALVWMTRTFIEQDKYGEAAGMINILQHDPNFPHRLKNDLDELIAYWFYRQQSFDSSAVYLEKSLSNIDDKAVKSRQYFLLGQLYEMSGVFDKASKYYSKAAHKTADPLLDIYARLNDAKMLRNSGSAKDLNNSILTLLKMAKKDKFESYRDILYYSAGVLSLKKPDTSQSIMLFRKSLINNQSNLLYSNKAHLALGKIAYVQKEYKKAADHYDSLDINMLEPNEDSAEVAVRKVALRKVANLLEIISNEDSLQVLATVSEKDRETAIKKQIKKYRKEKGEVAVEDEPIVQENALNATFDNNANNSIDLFDNAAKGEWYFYNNTLKSRGYSDFKSKWGKRENVDNWRRKSAISMAGANNNLDPMAEGVAGKNEFQAGVENKDNVSMESLSESIPLTPEKMALSNQKITDALIELAQLFEMELMDYQQAIFTYEIYLQRFPDSLRNGEIYLGLYHCYTKLNEMAKAAYYKSLIDSEFCESRSSLVVNKPSLLMPEKNNPEVEKLYQQVYDLFISGQFEEALKLKEKADCDYGDHFWTPQLLYIWSIYEARNRNDSMAVSLLNNIINNYPASSLKERAATLISVIQRRNEIEQYLNNLQITKTPDGNNPVVSPNINAVETKKPVSANPATTIVPKQVTEVKMDKSVVKDSAANPATTPSIKLGAYQWKADSTKWVVMLLDNVDEVYVNEAKNAFDRYNRRNNLNNISITKEVLDTKKKVLVFREFENADAALLYNIKLQKSAPSEVSWLQASRYSFFIISAENLLLMKSSKDIDNYKKLLKTIYPDKF